MLSCEACVRDRVEAPLAYLPQDRTRQAYALPTADALERAYWRAGFWSKPGNRSSTEGVQAGRTASAGAPCGRRWAHSYEETGLVQRAWASQGPHLLLTVTDLHGEKLRR